MIRLARDTWLMNRVDRIQEGCAMRQAQEMNAGRENRLHARMMRLAMTADTLRLLARSVACKHYVTPRSDLERIKNLHEEGVLADMSEIILGLFYDLQAPGTGEDGEDPEEKTRRVVKKIKGIFGITVDPVPEEDPASKKLELQERRDARYPRLSPAEWEARARPRHLLENLLNRQVEVCEEQRKLTLKGVAEGPVALRTRRGNSPHPAQRHADEENARLLL